MNAIFALVDCNNFYVSCERVFNPRLDQKAIVVLSNNDGCVIARSNEAKKLKIPMGAPFFKFCDFFKKNKVHLFSSNYALYGDMSARVMSSLESLCPEIEIYSIDEAFLRIESYSNFCLNRYAVELKELVKRQTGIPVSVGFAPTKTLAKIANHVAKKKTEVGVFNLCDESLREKILSEFPINDVWGIGSQHTNRLLKMGIETAKDLRDVNLKDFRKLFSVVMERTIQELRGNPCLQLEEVQPRKQIMSSRSFGKPVSLLDELEEATAFHVTKAGEKLRKQKSRASGIYFFLHTNPFSNYKKQYANSITCRFPEHTIDTAFMIRCAIWCLHQIFLPYYEYHKLGIMLLDLVPNAIHQQDLFLEGNQVNNIRREVLMNTIDFANKKMGRGTIKFCREGLNHDWALRENYRSNRFTTCLKEIPKVFCK